jgi:integrase
MTLSSDDLANLLNAEQLELLAEFADDLDPMTFTAQGPSRLQPAAAKPRSKKASKSTKGTMPMQPLQPLDIIMAAQAALLQKQTEASNFQAHKNEWAVELDVEVEDCDKSDHRLPAVPTRDEIRHLLEVSKVKKRDHIIIRTFYATGIRRSELEAAKRADLYRKEQKLFVRAGKGDKDRYVLLDRTTAKMLDDFTYGRALEDPLFDIEDQQMNRVCQKHAETAGILQRYRAMGRNFSAHSLRHAFATHLWESGIDVFILRDLLGHRYLGTTRRYVAIGLGRVVKDYNDHHPLCQRDFWNGDGD